MVTKSKKDTGKGEKEEKKGKVKVDKLKKETVRDLTPGERKGVRGGAATRFHDCETDPCP